MDIVIVNTSKLRVAIANVAKKQGLKSRTALFKANGLNSGIISDAEDRFGQYSDKIHFKVEDYTNYGVFYDDMWQQIVSLSPSIKETDFVLEKLEKPLQGATKYKELDSRITKLEDTVLRMMELVEKLRKDVG